MDPSENPWAGMESEKGAGATRRVSLPPFANGLITPFLQVEARLEIGRLEGRERKRTGTHWLIAGAESLNCLLSVLPPLANGRISPFLQTENG